MKIKGINFNESTVDTNHRTYSLTNRKISSKVVNFPINGNL